MKDADLKALFQIARDMPDPSAKAAALEAALLAFDEGLEEKFEAQTQGSPSGTRQSSKSTPFWRRSMTSVLSPLWTLSPTARAAVTGVAVLPVAALVTWHVMDSTQMRTEVAPEELALNLPGTAAPSPKRREAVPPALLESAAEPEADVSAPTLLFEAAPAPEVFSSQRLSAPSSLVSGAQQKSLYGSPGLLQDSLVPAAPRSDVEAERYQRFDDNAVVSTADSPVSTFSIDIDTASYARVRAALNAGSLPPRDMVRVEEMINYFDYAYPLPEDRSQPFKPTVRFMQTPWNAHTRLMHIGIKGYDLPKDTRPAANLVFLIDVSGSMSDANKLPLLISSFRLLLNTLAPTDTVSIVTYAGNSATVLDSTPASEKETILAALDNLQAGGSTAGEQGIQKAYRLAEKNFVKDGINRVMLATDGDFNVGLADSDLLKDLISQKRGSGIYFSAFGFGQGNYNDELMQALAQNGNGQAAYIDTLAEAQKVLVEEAGSTLFPIASDVKIQVEFNPAQITEYRLIGYETRALKREDFNNDKVDAGEIGAGHSVTALYEITSVGSPATLNDRLRYGTREAPAQTATSDELAFLKIRYKVPGADQSQLIEQPILDSSATTTAAHPDVGFAAAVAAFGQKLRGTPAVADMSYAEIADLANANKADDPSGYRAAFVQLVKLAEALSK